jgi:hypothetical protein
MRVYACAVVSIFARVPALIGRSEAARDWPFIQPRTDDAWAGSREHPFTIRFPFAEAPRGLFTLRIELTNAHSRLQHATDLLHLLEMYQRRARWVTSAKQGMSFRVVRGYPRGRLGNILRDDLVQMKSSASRRPYPAWLRRVVAMVEVDGQWREMTFLWDNHVVSRGPGRSGLWPGGQPFRASPDPALAARIKACTSDGTTRETLSEPENPSVSSSS